LTGDRENSFRIITENSYSILLHDPKTKRQRKMVMNTYLLSVVIQNLVQQGDTTARRILIPNRARLDTAVRHKRPRVIPQRLVVRVWTLMGRSQTLHQVVLGLLALTTTMLPPVVLQEPRLHHRRFLSLNLANPCLAERCSTQIPTQPFEQLSKLLQPLPVMSHTKDTGNELYFLYLFLLY
jgi:hypothetical protein